MLFSVISLVLLAVCVHSLFISKLLPWWAYVYSLAFLLVYNADAVATYSKNYLSLSPALGQVPFSSTAASRTLLLACACLALGLAIILVARPHRVRVPPSITALRLNSWPILALLPLLLAGRFWANIVFGGTLSAYLANRQLYLNQSLLPSIGYYLVPVGAAFSFYAARNSTGLFAKTGLYSLVLIYLSLGFLTGSRTTVLLGVVAPIVHWIVAIKVGDRGGRTLKVIVVTVMIACAYGGSQLYASANRGGGSADAGFFGSVDISQWDASVAVVDDGLRNSSTYAATLFFALPRSLWKDKPVSGNVVASEAIAPDRYQTTRSEVAVSIVGEGYMNVGMWGWLPSGILLGGWFVCLAAIFRRFERYGPEFSIFPLLFFYRGFNLIRGDLLNFAVPTVLTFVFLMVAFRGFRAYKVPGAEPTVAARSLGATVID